VTTPAPARDDAHAAVDRLLERAGLERAKLGLAALGEQR
jgi:hypothetical protein